MQPFFRRNRQAAPEAPPRRRPVARFFGTALRKTCTFIGAIVLLSALAGGAMALRSKEGLGLPGRMVLYMNLDGSYVEHVASRFPFGAQETPVRDIVDALDVAARDKRVEGLVAEWGGGISDMTQLEDIRNAVLRFRKSGKFAVIYAEDFTEGLGAYYLASGFGQIWLQPVGMLSLPGLRAEMPFARGLLDKAGVSPAFFARGEYKNLFESFERQDMSPATREAMTALVGDIGDTLLTGIAAGRGKKPEDIRQTVDYGLLTDTEAKRFGFVDTIGYRDALMEGIRVKLTGDRDDEDGLPFYRLDSYANAIRSEMDSRASISQYPHVALIYAVGEISSGSDETAAPYGAGDHIAADDLAADIRETARDESVRLIVLRVDSPGGSPTASETIRRAVEYAKGRGKKVYVSMGGAAASGGYWISSSADRIYASPLTLTGSIGVAGGKFVLKDMFGKLGVNWESVALGRNAGLQSFVSPYSDGERERMNAMFDRIYNGFIERVAQGRHMSLQRADEVARGRVWSGRQGKALGLVDKMGGLDTVLDDVAAELGQPDRFHLDVEVLPYPENPLEQLMSLVQGQVAMNANLKAQAALIAPFQPLLRQMGVAGRGDSGLTYEPASVR